MDYTTPKDRFFAWKTYKTLVDKEVIRLEKLYNEALELNSKVKEEIRFFLNEMYKTQYHLDKDMI